jgi:hypothetical protein
LLRLLHVFFCSIAEFGTHAFFVVVSVLVVCGSFR